MDLEKGLAYLFLGQVDRRRDDMARHLVEQLDDVFAQIGFHRLDAMGQKMIVDGDLLADHGLALGYGPRADASADLQHRGTRGIGVGAPIDLAAGALPLAGKPPHIQLDLLYTTIPDPRR